LCITITLWESFDPFDRLPFKLVIFTLLTPFFSFSDWRRGEYRFGPDIDFCIQEEVTGAAIAQQVDLLPPNIKDLQLGLFFEKW
jgi:hypothetical protein